MVFVQYERTRHGRMPSHKLSSGEIQLTSLQIFAVSSYMKVRRSQLRFSQLGEIGPVPLTIVPIHLTGPVHSDHHQYSQRWFAGGDPFSLQCYGRI